MCKISILQAIKNYFSGDEEEVEYMVTQAFALLRDSHINHNKIHTPFLEDVTKHISQKLFHIHDNTHRFNRMHYAYKLYIRPKMDYSLIIHYLRMECEQLLRWGTTVPLLSDYQTDA